MDGLVTAGGWLSREPDPDVRRRAGRIRFLLTDCDGVLTDTGVYYSSRGEEMKRFSMRDGMGVERLRKIAGIETGIVSGETSSSLLRRASKLGITEVHVGIRDKLTALRKLAVRRNLAADQIAYVGDDVNDLPAMTAAGLSFCPADAFALVLEEAHYVCEHRGGHGAFREVAELLIVVGARTSAEPEAPVQAAASNPEAAPPPVAAAVKES